MCQELTVNWVSPAQITFNNLYVGSFIMVVQGSVGYLLVVHRLKKVENHWSIAMACPLDNKLKQYP